MPSVSPLATEMLTCCTALTMPRRVANSTVRSLTSSSGGAVIMAAFAREAYSLAPLLRGRDERSSLLEGWGEGLLSAEAGEGGVLGGSPSPGSQERSDLSPQAGRGEERSVQTPLASSRPSLRIDDVAQPVAE